MSSVVAQHSALWDRGAFQEQQGAVARAKLVTGSSRQAGSTANMEQARLWQPSCVYRALQVGQQPHSLGAQQASNRVPIPGALRFATYPALPAAVCCTAQASCYCVQLATCPVNLVVLLPHLLNHPAGFSGHAAGSGNRDRLGQPAVWCKRGAGQRFRVVVPPIGAGTEGKFGRRICCLKFQECIRGAGC